CTFCGCVCDDIELHADAERIVETKRACILGEAWVTKHTAERRHPAALLGEACYKTTPAERLSPAALIDGKEATVDEAVEAAAEFLHAADMPLVYGLSNTTCEAQREAVWLAELVGGVIDSHTSLCNGPTEIGRQLGGAVKYEMRHGDT